MQRNTVIGTPFFLAPEIIQETGYNQKADIWSLGILLVEALTQQPPSWDRSQSNEPVVPPTIPEPFFSIARDCLQVDPVQRITLAEIKARLVPPQTIGEAIEPQSVTFSRKEVFSSPRAIAIVGVVIALFFFVAAFKFGYDLTPSDPLSLPGLPSRAQTRPPLQKSKAAPAAPAPDGVPATKSAPTELSSPVTQ